MRLSLQALERKARSSRLSWLRPTLEPLSSTQYIVAVDSTRAKPRALRVVRMNTVSPTLRLTCGGSIMYRSPNRGRPLSGAAELGSLSKRKQPQAATQSAEQCPEDHDEDHCPNDTRACSRVVGGSA